MSFIIHNVIQFYYSRSSCRTLMQLKAFHSIGITSSLFEVFHGT